MSKNPPFELPVEAQISVVDSDRRYITGTNGYPFICGDADKDYADYIVAVINSHEKLVDTLNIVLEWIDYPEETSIESEIEVTDIIKKALESEKQND